MSFTLAIIGRPNVGKSTLFNRLAGKRLALVDDTPGVTRDWRAAPARLGPLEFTVVDTAGLEEAFDGSLEARMRRQTEAAIGRADAVLFLIDARAGLTPLDRHFAEWLRRQPVPVILAANKSEGKMAELGAAEAYALGLGDPLLMSAEHNMGMDQLLEAIVALRPDMDPAKVEEENLAWEEAEAAAEAEDAPALSEEEEDAAAAALEAEADTRTVQLAIVGRPNAGKSTLMNALLGEERVLTGPEAGMTRDAITADWEYKGRSFKLVDTAGLRRKARVQEKLEKMAVQDALRVIRMAQTVVLLTDGVSPLDKQDLQIARLVLDEGRALVIAISKWDLIQDRDAVLKEAQRILDISLAQAKGVSLVTISALEGRRLDKLMDAVLDVYKRWNRRVGTSRLNRWLRAMTESHPPPMGSGGHRIRLRYMTQVKARPPTFAIWTSRPEDVPDSYARYLTNGLRQDFDLPGTPIRMYFRKEKNPFK